MTLPTGFQNSVIKAVAMGLKRITGNLKSQIPCLIVHEQNPFVTPGNGLSLIGLRFGFHLNDREVYMKCGAMPGLTRDGYAAPVGLNDAVDRGQPEPGAPPPRRLLVK